ncbi:MAG: hypothetical protein WA982_06695 [Rubrobacteraceae bacterium]
MSENVNDNLDQDQTSGDSRESGDPQNISLTEHALLLVVVLSIALIGNFVGPDISILAAIPGMLILYVITMIGLVITKYAPFYLPSIAWISLIAILATMPWIPGSEWLVARLENVDFLALATPVLAYAGLAITRNEVSTFRQSGWKIVLVALFVFIGTYVGSAAIAHLVLTIQGQI